MYSVACVVSKSSRRRVPFSAHTGMPVTFTRAAFLALLLLFGMASSVCAQTSTATSLSVTNTSSDTVTSVSSGTVVVLTATVTKSGGGNVTLGTVKFCDTVSPHCEDEYLAGSAQLRSNGTATLKFKPAPSEHVYQAFFHGTTSNAASTSDAQSLTVTAGPFNTSTAISYSSFPGSFAYRLTGTVTSVNSPPFSPNGTIDFLDTTNSNYVLASATLFAGANTSSLSSYLTYGAGYQPSLIAVADMNQDGIPDLVVADYSVQPESQGGAVTYSAINVLLGKGDGTFEAAIGSPIIGLEPQAIAVGDMNGDGYPDVVVVDSYSPTVYVFLNDGKGDGGLTGPNTYNFWDPNGNNRMGEIGSVALGDVNGDGKLDAILTFPYPDYYLGTSCEGGLDCEIFGVMYGNGDGTLQMSSTANPPPWVPVFSDGFGITGTVEQSTVALADLNGDGKLDVVNVELDAETAQPYVSVILGHGDGSFAAPVLYNIGGYGAGAVAVGDFNGDGIPDLVVTGYGAAGGMSSTVGVLYGNGDGTFQAIESYTIPSAEVPISVSTADMNGDGYLDAVTANKDSSISILYGNGTSPSSGGFCGPFGIGCGGGGGGTPFSSASNFPANLQGAQALSSDIPTPGIAAVGDLNGDGVIDVAVPNYSTGDANVLLGSITSTATATSQAVLIIGKSGSTDSIESQYQGDAYFAPSSSGTVSLQTAPATTSLALQSNASTVTVGDQITLTATLSPYTDQGYSTDGEPVTFYNNGTSIIGTANLSGGVATLKPNLTTVASYSITATYGGDSNFVGSSTTSAVSVTVQKAATTLTLQVCNYVSNNWICPATTSNYGGQLTVTATLSPSSVNGGGNSDGETITFYNNGTVYSTATLSGGSATLNLDQIPAGSYSFSASYGGDASFIASSTSSASSMTVAKVTPSVTFATYPVSTTTYGQRVSLTATFSTYPYVPDGEPVTFYNGTNIVGTAPFAGNAATLKFTNLAVGSYSYSASYSGDTNWNSTNTNTAGLAVQQLPTVLTVTSGAPGAVIYGTPITLQASLEPHNVLGGNTTNNESITFYQNGTAVGTGPLSNGNASYTVNVPPVGNDSYTASYAGDTSFATSTTSQADTITVEKASTTMGIVTNGVNGNIGSGQPITLTATVSAYPLSVTSTNGEPVTFYQGSSNLGTGTLSNGAATFSLPNGLAEGTFTFSASFPGDTNFNGSSTSSYASLIVLQSTTLTLTTSPVNFAALNQPITITATLSPYTVGAHGTNNEPITLLNNGSATNGGNLSNGVVTISFPIGLPQGSYSFSALYDGDGTLAGSTSATVAFSVATVENFVVNVNTDDGGPAGNCSPQSSTTHNGADTSCSLRDALLAAANAPEGANITFDTAAFSAPTTITLTDGTLTVPSNTTITAPTSGSGPNLTNLVTVNGNGTSIYQTSSTVFAVTGTGTAMSNLIITGGWPLRNYGNNSNGGGITNSGSLVLANSTITNNGALNFGGGIYNTGTLTVVGCTFAGNTGAADGIGDGGGIDNAAGTLTVVNSTFANNATPDGWGGGIGVDAGTATITNSTISGNLANGGGGGISTVVPDINGVTSNGGTVTLANTIVNGNSDFLSDIDDGTVPYTDKGGNNIGFLNRTSPAVNDPNLLNLGPLGNYGGPMQTMLPLPGSQAICGGTLANSPNQWQPQSVQIDTDQRGFLNYTGSYRLLGGPSLCVDAGSVQTNYTGVQIAPSSSTGLAGGAVTPASVVTVIENGLNQGGIPITLSYSGAGNLSGNSSTTVASAGASFPSLSVDSAGNGNLSATLDITPCVTTCSWVKLSAAANLSVLAPMQISPASEIISAVGGAPLSQTFSVSGASGSYQLTNSGTLPEGLTLTPSGASTGLSWTLSGAPTQNGSYNFTLTATDANYSLFTISQNYTVTVAPATTTTLVASPASSAAYGQTVTLTATVSSPTATGTVSFFDGGNLLGSGGVSVSGGSPNTAALALNASTLGSPLAFGGHTFTAQYSGDATDAASTSNTINYSVAAPNFVVNTTIDDNGSFPCTPLASTASNTTDGNNGGNPGLCALRDALNTASGYGAGSIYFDTTVFAAASTISVDVTDFGSLNPPSNTTIYGLTAGSGASLTNLVTVNGQGAGGTIFVANASNAAINNLNINNGYAPGGGSGGAITNFGSLTVSGTSFTGNQATGSGGAIYNYEGTLTVVNSTFVGNSATGGNGGAIVNTAPDNFGFTTISNSTFYQNTASNGGSGLGGALYNDSFSEGSLSITNSTIFGNSAETAGGGIFDSSSLDLANSIVSGNSSSISGADDIDDYYGEGSTFYWGASGNNANVIGFYDGTPQNGTTASLAPFRNYGGPTQTMIPLPGSPAICNGIANGTTTDQRGDLTQPTGGYCPSGSVDSGSVQTNYAISFTTHPPSSGNTGVALNPAPVVTLTESGTVFTAGPGTIAISDADADLDGSSTTSISTTAGQASFTDLVFTNAESGDTLTATVALNPAISATSPAISSVSNAFNLTQPGAPFGHLDTVADSVTGSSTVGQLDSVVVKGWAADQVDGAPLSNINVYVDGNLVSLAGAPILGGARPGVAAAYGAAYLNSEFQLTFSASTLALGSHAVTVVVIDSGGRSTTLGPINITVATITAPPFGHLDTVADSVTGSTTVGQLDSVVVKGWAADQVDGAPLNNVNVYVDGNLVSLTGAPILGGARPGVAAAYGAAYLNSEFQLTFSASTLALGSHAVTVVVIDSGARSTTLGPLNITVATITAPPFGHLDTVADSVTGSSTVGQLDSVVVKGWAADQVDGAPLSNINVYVDGNLISLAGAPILGGARPGVAAAYGAAYLNSEFQLTFSASTLALGSHAVTVVATDSGGRSTTFGPLNFTVQ